MLCICDRSRRLGFLKTLLGDRVHAELSRSAAADAYVWKLDTRVEGTCFELGQRPFRRNNKRDWGSILEAAKSGRLDDIDPSVVVCHYRSLRCIASDFGACPAIERRAIVYWGGTQLGKSRRAWHEAGYSSYAKDPRTKWWDGYRGEKHVIVDEFRGTIDISHILRWLDRYPVRVEVKGSTIPLLATTFWFTSNIAPDKWYPDLDLDTFRALERRLEIVHFTEEWVPDVQ